MQPLTNYRMGTGLAATIMGQQAGLEAESQGLANLMKGMQMPAEALKGQEAAMLMQDPNYLQQKTANTLIELSNQYQASDFQQTLNAANRVKIQLDAAAGDPNKERQIVMQALSALKMDPNSEFGQYAMRDPRGALDKFIQGTEVAMTRSAKQIGAEKIQGMQDTAAMERTLLKEKGDTARAGMSAGVQAAAANKALTGQMIQYSNQLRQELDNLNTNLRQLETKELDNAIMQDLIKRGNKNPSTADVEKAKSGFKSALEDRKKLVEDDLTTVRGSVGKQLGLKSTTGTGGGNYDYVPGQGLVQR
jgi:hypothetical protein